MSACNQRNRTGKRPYSLKKYTSCLSVLWGKFRPDRDMSEPVTSKALVYGGSGALGSKCVHHLKTHNWWVGCIDFTANQSADVNVIVSIDDKVEDQQRDVLNAISSIMEGHKLDVIFCVSGGWVSGTAAENLVGTTSIMWQKNVSCASICTAIAVKHLREGGLLIFTGAKCALASTPTMIGFGLAKAAVHQLIRSLAERDSGMPTNSIVLGILPATLDSHTLRDTCPEGDVGNLTPLQYVAELILRWSSGKDVPKTGSLCQLITNNFTTDVLIL